MSDPLLTDLLSARAYETADPATLAEVARNAAIAELDGMIARKAAGQQPAQVVQLRANSRR
jgi:hypothetical protein